MCACPSTYIPIYRILHTYLYTEYFYIHTTHTHAYTLSLPHAHTHTHTHTDYIYIYIYIIGVCVCVCVCVRERECVCVCVCCVYVKVFCIQVCMQYSVYRYVCRRTRTHNFELCVLCVCQSILYIGMYVIMYACPSLSPLWYSLLFFTQRYLYIYIYTLLLEK